jgi:hypothetical protein
MPDPTILVATVTVVFAGRAGGPPEDVATALLEHEDVSTVRVNAHGDPSGYRVDVLDQRYEEASDRASGIAEEVARRLGLTAEVRSVGLVRDSDRVEVFRAGGRGDDLVWGER